MAAKLAEKGRQLATKVLIFQSMVAVIVAVLFTLAVGQKAGLSAVYGGLVSIIPSLVFARFAFRYAGASQNELVVRSFSQGSKLKLLVTILLFVGAFRWLEAIPMPLFSGFALTMATQWVALFVLRNND